MTELALVLHAQPGVLIALATLLGLIVGSFLNVVIYRLPVMMDHDWRAQCSEYLGLKTAAAEDAQQSRFTLSTPRSHCPKCGHTISAWENIPLLSYLLQRGRCRHCQAAISLRYPAIELLTAVLSAVVVWHFGLSWQAAAALVLTWALIALSFIDLDHQLLPDNITLPLLWLGLGLNLSGLFTDSHTSVIGAMAGYLVLWTVYHLFRLITGKEGMGHGDFKLLGMLGAWMGWQYLPAIILLSSVVGALLGIAMIIFLSHDRRIPIPFGPYLAIAGWVTLLWGEKLLQWYMNWAMPS